MTLYRDNSNPPTEHTVERTPLPAISQEVWSFKTRDDFPDLMGQYGLNGVGVEVGVYRAGFSTHILKHWPGVLHLVDPWEYQPDKRDLLNTPEAPENERIARQAMQEYVAQGRCVFHKGYSLEVAREILAGPWSPLPSAPPFDWAYIDALHDYESCLADMRAWAPLIR